MPTQPTPSINVCMIHSGLSHTYLHNAVTMTAFWPMIFWISSWTVHWGSLKLKFDQELMIFSGLVESISFNVSSLVPPSPIPANTTVESYTRKTRSQAMKKKHEKDTAPAADIMMLPPETEWAAFLLGHKCLLIHKIFHLHWIWRKHSRIKGCKALNSVCVSYLYIKSACLRSSISKKI